MSSQANPVGPSFRVVDGSYLRLRHTPFIPDLLVGTQPPDVELHLTAQGNVDWLL